MVLPEMNTINKVTIKIVFSSLEMIIIIPKETMKRMLQG